MPSLQSAVPSSVMKKTVILYGALCGLLIAGLKAVEYRFLVVEHSLEIYGGLVAVVFAGLGLWLGLATRRVMVALVGLAWLVALILAWIP